MADEMRLSGVQGREHVSVQWALAASRSPVLSRVSNGSIGTLAQRRQPGREGGSALREQWAWLVGGGSLALWYNTPVKQVGCYRMGWGDQDHHPSTMLAPGAGDGKGRGGWAKRESE